MAKEVIGSIYSNMSDNFQTGISPISRCVKAENNDLSVVETTERRLGNIYGFDGGNYAGNIYDDEMLSPTIRTYQGGNQQPMIVAMRGRNSDNQSDRTSEGQTEQRLEPSEAREDLKEYRIRKLTPLECWRLMGFSDEDFHKAEKVNSNSQMYKQAGNSIVKNVLIAIFRQMM